jgi:hypothetical protein
MRFVYLLIFLFTFCRVSLAWDSSDSATAIGIGFKTWQEYERKKTEEFDRQLEQQDREFQAQLEASRRKAISDVQNELIELARSVAESDKRANAALRRAISPISSLLNGDNMESCVSIINRTSNYSQLDLENALKTAQETVIHDSFKINHAGPSLTDDKNPFPKNYTGCSSDWGGSERNYSKLPVAYFLINVFIKGRFIAEYHYTDGENLSHCFYKNSKTESFSGEYTQEKCDFWLENTNSLLGQSKKTKATNKNREETKNNSLEIPIFNNVIPKGTPIYFNICCASAMPADDTPKDSNITRDKYARLNQTLFVTPATTFLFQNEALEQMRYVCEREDENSCVEQKMSEAFGQISKLSVRLFCNDEKRILKNSTGSEDAKIELSLMKGKIDINGTGKTVSCSKKEQ